MSSPASAIVTALFVAGGFPCPSFGGSAEHLSMITDINTFEEVRSSDPRSFTTTGATTFFIAGATETGDELWRTDGTVGGTTLVKDLELGIWGSGIKCIVVVEDSLYFLASVPGDEYQAPREVAVWKSDGTASGTTLIQRMTAYQAYAFGCPMASMGGRAFAAIVDPSWPRRTMSVWRTDGSPTGTVRIHEAAFGTELFDPEPVAAGNRLYFRSFSQADGVELWSSDGTMAGTQIVKDIRIGPDSAAVGEMVPVGRHLLFTVSAEANQRSVWRSDGTNRGTQPLMPAYIHIGPRAAVDGQLYVSMLTPAGEWDVVATDGTAGGTHTLLSDVAPLGLTVLGRSLFYFAWAGDGVGLWRLDPGSREPSLLTEIEHVTAIGQIVRAADGFFFSINPDFASPSLWHSNGTTDGTVRLTDEGQLVSLGALAVDNGLAYFAAGTGDYDTELWRSDGTPAGTRLLKNIARDDVETRGSFPSALTVISNQVLFTAQDATVERGHELWRTDGTAAGTELVKDVNPEPYRDSLIRDLTRFRDAVFFGVGNPFWSGPLGLWKSDGTASGTGYVSPHGVDASQLTVAGPWLFFLSFGTSDLGQVCRTDGGDTPLRCAGHFLSNIQPLVPYGERVVFSAAERTESDSEVWVSDGSFEGTTRVKDISAGDRGSAPAFLTPFDNAVFFAADDGVHRQQLWKTDGTEAGTVMVNMIPGLGSGSKIAGLTATEDLLFFTIEHSQGGSQLWVTDGSPAGARLVRDVDVSGALIPFGHSVLLVGSDPAHGAELWISDGTTDGTRLVRDIYPGPPSSMLYGFVAVGHRAMFVACTNLGCEPWSTDGTAGGTKLLGDIAPGFASSYPHDFSLLNRHLLFAATDSIHGNELWSLDLNAACAGDCDGDVTVGIADLVAGVGIALGRRSLDACTAMDGNGDGAVTIDELVGAVDAALSGCL